MQGQTTIASCSKKWLLLLTTLVPLTWRRVQRHTSSPGPSKTKETWTHMYRCCLMYCELSYVHQLTFNGHGCLLLVETLSSRVLNGVIRNFFKDRHKDPKCFLTSGFLENTNLTKTLNTVYFVGVRTLRQSMWVSMCVCVYARECRRRRHKEGYFLYYFPNSETWQKIEEPTLYAGCNSQCSSINMAKVVRLWTLAFLSDTETEKKKTTQAIIASKK